MPNVMKKVPTPAGPVSVALDGPEDSKALLVLAHGAGGDMNSGFMTSIAAGLAERGLRTLRFNFPYAERGRRSPDRQEVLEEAYGAVLAEVPETRSRRLILGGKSLGGRIASHLVAAGASADGLVFLGYPLHPPGHPERLRDAHLHDISAPMLFVEGTRDPFCPLPTLERVRKALRAPSSLAVIEGGDHSFKVPKSSGRSAQDAWAEVGANVAEWVARLDPSIAREPAP